MFVRYALNKALFRDYLVALFSDVNMMMEMYLPYAFVTLHNEVCDVDDV